MTQPVPPSHKRPTNLTRFYYGSPYYPEHWDEDTRAQDADRMAAAGWNMVRMAEFAWDLMEPQPGQYDFSIFDETIARMGEKGIVTMMCTPTATPPRWLTYAYPEMLRVNADGVTMQHGSRQHACYSSEMLREYSRKITRAMARHFAENPHVVGWQTDNEINCQMPECHCESCQVAFREYLRGKYEDDITALNAAWGNQFWSMSYANFDEIDTPRPDKPTHPNPSQMLDYARFLNWTVTRFQHDQVEILREVNPKWFVTHNGMFRHIDYRGKFTTDLDFIGYDLYPFFNYTPATRPYSMAYNLDQARAWSGNYFVPEQQSGPGGQSTYFHDTPEPGEMRRMAYTSIARGADGLMFFRWRTARFGAEEYWCGILDHDSVPRRRYEEAARLGAELKTLGPELLGTHVFVNVGIAAADQEVYDAHAALHLGIPGPEQMAREAHGFFLKRGYAVGCVHPSDDLTDLALYVIPHWPMFDPAWVPNLTRYVENGGVLVIGARTATKDLNNHVISVTPPGVLADLAGVTVEEFGKQNAPDERPLWVYLPTGETHSRHWYEVLQPRGEDVRVIGTWKSRHLTGQPAVTVRPLGQGFVVYAGTYLTNDMLDQLMPEIEQLRSIPKIWPFAPEGVQVVKRQNAEKEIWFFINTTEEDLTVERLPEGADCLTGQPCGAAVTLTAHDVAVVQTTRTATPAI